MRDLLKNPVLSWAMYDWANSAFATTVMAGFFPLFFKQYWSAGVPVTTSTFQLGLTNSMASTVIVLIAPVLGAIADTSHAKKRLLLLFAGLGILMTAGLYFVAKGEAGTALTLFAFSIIGFSGSVVFYDSLIIGVCSEQDYDRVSAFGFAMGYLGGGILFAINVCMTLKPDWFGFVDATEAVRVSFLSVAVWWLLFSVPLLLYVHEPGLEKKLGIPAAIRGGFRQLKTTFVHIRRLRMVFLFLLAYWLYIDGVDTIVRMAIDYGMSIGLEATDLITALLITQFVGFPAAIAFGVLGQRIGAKRGIMIAIGVYLLAIIWAYQMDSSAEFYGLAVTIGLVQGGIQSLSRSFYARLIPPAQAAEFFGFYNMLGKFAAVLGPVLIGLVAWLTESTRLSILSIIVLFISGAVILLFVKSPTGTNKIQQGVS